VTVCIITEETESYLLAFSRKILKKATIEVLRILSKITKSLTKVEVKLYHLY